jgi:hypothetical protein
MKRVLAILIIGLLLASVPATIGLRIEDTGSKKIIFGMVIDAETKKPIPNAIVVARKKTHYGFEEEKRALTDKNGFFVVNLAKRGKYRLDVFKQGYEVGEADLKVGKLGFAFKFFILEPVKLVNVVVDANTIVGELPDFFSGVTGYKYDNFKEIIDDIGVDTVSLGYVNLHFLPTPENETSYWDYLRKELKPNKIRQIKAGGGEPVIIIWQMPKWLSSFDCEGCTHWLYNRFGQPEFCKGAAAPPIDYSRWGDICYDVLYYLNVIERLDVKYFHVWGEPASGLRWTGNFNDYCRLYKASVEGVNRFNREQNQNVRIGGPKCNTRWGQGNESFRTDSMTGRPWWQDFVDYCAAESLTLDYLSWNYYPQISIFGEWDRNVKSFKDKTLKIRRYLDAKGFEDTQVFVTEWNPGVWVGGYDQPDTRLLSHYGSAFVAAAFYDILGGDPEDSFYNDYIPPDRHTFYTYQDYPYESKYEKGWHKMGLFEFDKTTSSLSPKPAYNTFKLFKILGEKRLSVDISDAETGKKHAKRNGLGAIASYENDAVSLLIWDFRPIHPTWFKTVAEEDATISVKIIIDNLKFSSYSWQLYRIDKAYSNAFYDGENPHLEIAEEGESSGITFSKTIELPVYGVALLRLSPAPFIPQGLRIKDSREGSIELEWNSNEEDDLRGYKVYRSVEQFGDYECISNVVADSCYIDRGLPAGVTFYYKVTAVDNEGFESEFSKRVAGDILTYANAFERNQRRYPVTSRFSEGII